MKQRNLMKKTGAFLLAAAMAITAIPVFSIPVFAEESDTGIDKTKFATVDELKSFNTDDTSQGEDKNPARVYFGNNKQQWWIAGSQNKNVTLFAASPLVEEKQPFEQDWENNKTYDNSWDCKYSNGAPSEVYPNHYGASDIRNTLQGMTAKDNLTYFSDSEQKLMNATIVYTNDEKYQDDNGEANQDDTALKKESVYYTKDKLYLPYGDYQTGNDKYITVGNNSLPDKISTVSDLNNGLRVDMDYWGSKGSYFWLRAPRFSPRVGALIAIPGFIVDSFDVDYVFALVPAFELNLSNVSFASAAPAASSDKDLEVQDVVGKDVDDNGKVTLHGAFTLRYDADKYDKDLGSAEVSFDKSKVTLTGATKDKDVYLVVQNSAGAWAKKVTDQTTSVSASDMGLDSFANCKVWLETTDTMNRITYATLATDGQPIELPSEITFESQHIGYDDVAAQTVEMKNIGNAEISNINAVLTGENADKFTLDTTGMQEALAPSKTTSFTVKPKNDLGAGTYTAQIQVTGAAGVSKTIPVSFTVGEHEYAAKWSSDETSHWHECACEAKADQDTHTFKWVVDKEATATEKGLKHEECSVCGYKKASVEIPVVTSSNAGKPDGDKPGSGKGSVKTGDNAPTGLLVSMLSVSILGMVCAVAGRKRKR